MTDRRVNCFSCEHFFVTWDTAQPRGCRALGFKCRDMPAHAVRGASGQPCLYFQQKEKGKRADSA